MGTVILFSNWRKFLFFDVTFLSRFSFWLFYHYFFITINVKAFQQVPHHQQTLHNHFSPKTVIRLIFNSFFNIFFHRDSLKSFSNESNFSNFCSRSLLRDNLDKKFEKFKVKFQLSPRAGINSIRLSNNSCFSQNFFLWKFAKLWCRQLIRISKFSDYLNTFSP